MPSLLTQKGRQSGPDKSRTARNQYTPRSGMRFKTRTHVCDFTPLRPDSSASLSRYAGVCTPSGFFSE
jgi:hypothetical protein